MPYTKLVTVSRERDGVVLRRWQRTDNAAVCTHSGVYAEPSVTCANVANYQAYGAPQDRLCVTRPLPRPARQTAAA